MSIEPEVADFLFVFAIVGGNASSDARGDRVISAKNEREETFAERFFDGGGKVFACFRDFLKILGALFADLHFLGLLHFEVADVFDGKAELLDARLKTCTAKGGGTHVHAAAALAEVHGYANDAGFLRHALSVTGDW